MISQVKLQEIVLAQLQGTDYELITCEVKPGDELLVEIDRLAGVDVDYCSQLNHAVCEALDAEYGEDADYSLELGSVSLTDPFRTRMQYQKHLGKDVEVLAADGKKYRGQLVSVDNDSFSIDTQAKVKVEGKKRPELQTITMTWGYGDVKYTRYDLKF